MKFVMDRVARLETQLGQAHSGDGRTTTDKRKHKDERTKHKDERTMKPYVLYYYRALQQAENKSYTMR
jgi:hypothetical protein